MALPKLTIAIGLLRAFCVLSQLPFLLTRAKLAKSRSLANLGAPFMFFFPLFDENSTSRRPIVVWMMMATCIMVFVWQQSLDDVSARLALYQLGFVPTIVFQGDTLPT